MPSSATAARSSTTRPGTAPPPVAAAHTSVATSSGEHSGRAASWISTRSSSPARIAGSRWRSARSSEPWRLAPPTTSSTGTGGCGNSSARVRSARSTSSARTTSTSRVTPGAAAAIVFSEIPTAVRPASGRYALLRSPPTRSPDPPASTTTPTRASARGHRRVHGRTLGAVREAHGRYGTRLVAPRRGCPARGGLPQPLITDRSPRTHLDFRGSGVACGTCDRWGRRSASLSGRRRSGPGVAGASC